MTPETAALATELDFSLWALFARATLTVQIVMLLLIAMSIWAWAITIQKVIAYRAARKELTEFEAAFWSGQALDDLYDSIGPTPPGAAQKIFAAGMTEWRRSQRNDGAMIPNAGQRIDRVMDLSIARQSEGLSGGLSFLATTGATAPFIGLFGTVWGIKHAFEQIAIAQNTNLAVVAPGIAEALLATGLGLLAAIPAVVFYNKLSSDAAIPAVVFYNKLSSDADALTGGYEAFADEFSTILSRQLEV